MVRFFRQRSRIVGALGTPLVFWLLIGSGVGSSFAARSAVGNMGYLEYFFPGTVLLVLLFTFIFSTISFDLNHYIDPNRHNQECRRALDPLK